MRTKRQVFRLALLLATVIAVALWVRYREATVVRNRLEARAAAGAASFDFAAETPFQWDRMYVFGPYTPRQQVEKSLGFAWPNYPHTGINDSKADCLVLFVRGNQVVYWYNQPRTIELSWLVNDKGYGRRAATFQIDRSEPGRPALKPTGASPATMPSPATIPSGKAEPRSLANE